MMEKLEKHIKKRLEERQIQPSEKAWESIENSLNTKVAEPRKRTYWYAIAASLIGVLMLTSVYFSRSAEQPQNKVVVNTETISEQSDAIEQAAANTKEAVSEKRIVQPLERAEAKTKVSKPAIEEVVQNESLPSLKDDLLEMQQLVIDQKVDEVFAQVSLLKSQNANVTDAEVDSLLRAAQKEIFTDQLFDQEGSVDAMALLEEVENELDESFRDQIFEALKEGYFKLKTAVADRNN